MKSNKNERHIFKEFFEFLEAKDAFPSDATDETIFRIVAKSLHPARWKVYLKLTLVQIASGLTTLTICPQFGVGLGAHKEILHALHAGTNPVVFYLVCGLFFVLLGGALGGIILNRQEAETIAPSRCFYFAAYSILAYLSLVIFGSEVFLATSLSWMLGAMIGNTMAFEAGFRLRKAIHV